MSKKSAKSLEVAIDVLTCPECHDKIWSKNRHDVRYCKCGYCYIDGGRDYTRVGYGRDGQVNPTPPTVDTRWLDPAHIANPYIDTLDRTRMANIKERGTL